MAHTDRDDARKFWKDHFARCGGGHCWDRGEVCWCASLSVARKWVHPYRHESGIPSYYHRDCRRAERAKARNALNRARCGHVDWDDLAISYRRPYYW